MTKLDQHAAPAMTELSEGEPCIKTNPVESVVGARIRSLREAAGMTQGDLASRVFVSRQTVINWEKGVSQTKGYLVITRVYLLAEEGILLLS